MSKQAQRRQHRPSASGPAAPSFTPVPVRARHDGWTPARQVLFLQTLAECACVEEACRAVGMSPRSAYDLKARGDASSFRQAWERVLDYAVGRIGDAMVGRALNGEFRPVFYKGEQIGERRVFDNRLGMWILSRRQPQSYGAWRDRVIAESAHPDGCAWIMKESIRRVAAEGLAEQRDEPRPHWPPLKPMRFADDPAQLEAERRADAAREAAEREESFRHFESTLVRHTSPGQDPDAMRDPVAMLDPDRTPDPHSTTDPHSTPDPLRGS